MPQVVIQFEGICVNFKRSDFPFLPAAHRIVLINASKITDVWGHLIAPHVAAFRFDLNPKAPSTALTGAVVEIANPVQTGVSYDASYDDISSLRVLTPELSPVVSMAVLTGHNPALASCYFDVDHGVISAKVSALGATMTRVTIQTTEEPLYLLAPFPAILSSSPREFAVRQPATSQMFFSNEETKIEDASDSDFLLSYLVVSQPPSSTPNLPPTRIGDAPNRKSELAKILNPMVGLSDLGCSNSAYP